MEHDVPRTRTRKIRCGAPLGPRALAACAGGVRGTFARRAALAGLALFAAHAGAQVSTFTGASANDPLNWCNPVNWQPQGVPADGAVINIGPGFDEVSMHLCENMWRILGPISAGSPVRFWTPVVFSQGGSLFNPRFELSSDPAPITGALALSGDDSYWRGAVFSGGAITNSGTLIVETKSQGARPFPRELRDGCVLTNQNLMRLKTGFEVGAECVFDSPGSLGVEAGASIGGAGAADLHGIVFNPVSSLVLGTASLTLSGPVHANSINGILIVRGGETTWTGEVFLHRSEVYVEGDGHQRLGPLNIHGDGDFKLDGDDITLIGDVQVSLTDDGYRGFWFSSLDPVTIDGRVNCPEGVMTWSAGEIRGFDPQRAEPHIDLGSSSALWMGGRDGESGPTNLRSAFLRTSGDVHDFDGVTLLTGSRIRVSGGGTYRLDGGVLEGDDTGLIEIEGSLFSRGDSFLRGSTVRVAESGRIEVEQGRLVTGGSLSPLELKDQARISVLSGAEWRSGGRTNVLGTGPSVDGEGNAIVTTTSELLLADGAKFLAAMQTPGSFVLEGSLGAGADDPGTEGFRATFDNTGEWLWRSGSITFPVEGDLARVVNAGTLIATCSGCRLGANLINSGSMIATRTISIQPPGATILNSSNLILENGSIHNASEAQGKVRNEPGATISKTGSADGAIGVSLDNPGRVIVEAGVFNITGQVFQFSGGALVGGTWVVNQNATLRTPGKIITVVGPAADVAIAGAWPEFQVNNVQGSLAAGGSRTIPRTVVTSGRFMAMQDGTIEFTGPGSTLRMVNGTVELMPGSTVRVLGATIPVEGGTLQGSGTVVTPRVANSGGTVSPGHSPGTLTVDGDYEQQAGGTLSIEIGGLMPDAEHDVLVVTGTAFLGGTLRVALVDGFEPAPGSSFMVIAAGGLDGRFDMIDMPDGFDVGYTGAGVVVGPSLCLADLTKSSDPLDPTYGLPDGVVDGSDFFYYLDSFAAMNLLVADRTTSSDPNDASYGVPDGVLDGSDFFYYLDLFAAGCP